MKKLLFSLGLIFILTLSLASAIVADGVWNENGVYSQDPITLEQGEVQDYIVEAYTTAGPNGGVDHWIGLDVGLFEAGDFSSPVSVFLQIDSLYSYDTDLVLDTTSLPLGDYTIVIQAQDFNDTDPSTGMPRMDIAMLNFTLVEPTFAPVMQEVVVSPANPTDSDDLNGACMASDQDTTNLTYEYQWLEGGLPVTSLLTAGPALQNTLVSVDPILGTQTNVGENWELRCRATDGVHTTDWLTSSVVMIGEDNSVPITVDSFVLPLQPSDDDPLEGYCSASDSDGDAVSFNWEWTRNGNVVQSGQSIAYSDLSNYILVNTYDSAFTSIGDDFMFSCQAFDGIDTGAWVDSDVVTVVGGSSGNLAPENLSVVVIPNFANESQNIIGSCSADDPNGDLLQYDVEWYRNGTYMNGITSNWMNSGSEFNYTLFAADTTVGDVWTFSCVATDGNLSVGPQNDSVVISGACLSNPIATFNGPTQILVGNTGEFDGGDSSASGCGSIISYDWNVTCNGVSSTYSSNSPLMSHTFDQLGTCSVSLTVTDNLGLTDTDSVTVVVVSSLSNLPVAKISHPSTVLVDEEFVVSGLQSTVPEGQTIVSYDWTLTHDSGVLVDTYSGALWYVTVPTLGEYTFELTITSSNGLQDSVSGTVLVQEEASLDEEEKYIPKDNLQVSSVRLMGSDFELVSPGEYLYVSVNVENNFDERLEDLQVTFLLPELGKFKSSAKSLSSGDSKTITLVVDIPFYFETGYYYPKIIVTADGHRRVKVSQFEVYSFN